MSDSANKGLEGWRLIILITVIFFVAFICGGLLLLQKYSLAGKPLMASNLQESVVYEKADTPDLFWLKEVGTKNAPRIYWLLGEYPDKFIILGTGKNRQIISVPKKTAPNKES